MYWYTQKKYGYDSGSTTFLSIIKQTLQTSLIFTNLGNEERSTLFVWRQARIHVLLSQFNKRFL